mgnify:CR=1 FL=1
MIGVTTTPEGQTYAGANTGDEGFSQYSADGSLYPISGSYTAWGVGDIASVAYDSVTRKTWIAKNGTWQNSGVPTSGSTGTGAVSITAGKTYGFGFSGYDATVFDCNFGNGYFGTTAVASAGSNASGVGIFEYDVPAGYAGLSTQGLNK